MQCSIGLDKEFSGRGYERHDLIGYVVFNFLILNALEVYTYDPKLLGVWVCSSRSGQCFSYGLVASVRGQWRFGEYALGVWIILYYVPMFIYNVFVIYAVERIISCEWKHIFLV